jgi:hypothetical protein
MRFGSAWTWECSLSISRGSTAPINRPSPLSVMAKAASSHPLLLAGAGGDPISRLLLGLRTWNRDCRVRDFTPAGQPLFPYRIKIGQWLPCATGSHLITSVSIAILASGKFQFTSAGLFTLSSKAARHSRHRMQPRMQLINQPENRCDPGVRIQPNRQISPITAL